MDNSTLLPENDGPLNSPGFMAYSIVLAVIKLVAGLMIRFTILALLKATSIPGPVRLFLINLLLAGLLVAVASMFYGRHFCCPHKCELKLSQTTVPMQSVLVGICYRSSGTPVEPGSILILDLGHSEILARRPSACGVHA